MANKHTGDLTSPKTALVEPKPAAPLNSSMLEGEDEVGVDDLHRCRWYSWWQLFTWGVAVVTAFGITKASSYQRIVPLAHTPAYTFIYTDASADRFGIELFRGFVECLRFMSAYATGWCLRNRRARLNLRALPLLSCYAASSAPVWQNSGGRSQSKVIRSLCAAACLQKYLGTFEPCDDQDLNSDLRSASQLDHPTNNRIRSITAPNHF